MQTVGVVSTGATGSGVANALVRGGVRVVGTVAGRSARTVALAERGGLELLPDVSAVVRKADVVLSIVPPEAAETVAAAVKMSTVSVYKGTTALLTHALLAADANGVLGHVLDDLGTGSPELVANVARRLAMATSKSGRYVGEMREIAHAQSVAGLTPALFEALAEVYVNLARTPFAEAAPEEIASDVELRDVLDGLR